MSLSVPSLKVLEMLPSVPLDLAMRVLQSVVKEGAFYLLDPPAILTRKIVSRVLNLDPRQQVIWCCFFPQCRDLFCGITASKTLQSKHLQPLRYGWPLSTWRRCWRFKWRNIARGGKISPLFSLDEIHYFLFFFIQELGGDAEIAAANKTDDEKLTEAGLAAALGVVTDIITDDMKNDLAGRWHHLWWWIYILTVQVKALILSFSCRETPVTDEEKAGAAWAEVFLSVEVM